MWSSKAALGASVGRGVLARRQPPRICARSRSVGNAASRSSKRGAIVTSATTGPSSRRASRRPPCPPTRSRRATASATCAASASTAPSSAPRSAERSAAFSATGRRHGIRAIACSRALPRGPRSAQRRRATSARRRAEAEAEEPSDYLRALTACLEGRGYSVALPTAADLTATPLTRVGASAVGPERLLERRRRSSGSETRIQREQTVRRTRADRRRTTLRARPRPRAAARAGMRTGHSGRCSVAAIVAISSAWRTGSGAVAFNGPASVSWSSTNNTTSTRSST